MERGCGTCDNLVGCPLLTNKKGEFDPKKLVTDGGRRCTQWSAVGDRKALMYRTAAAQMGGDGTQYFRLLHGLPKKVMEPLKEQELKDEEMNAYEPDFDELLYEGITNTEREEQLRFQTDEEGNWVVDGDGRRLPNSDHIVKKYAFNPEGHIALNHSEALFWHLNKVIDHIVRTEVKQGLVVRVKKNKQEESDMPGEGRRVVLNRRSGSPAKGGKTKAATAKGKGGKVPSKAKGGTAVARKGATGKTGKAATAKSKKGSAAEKPAGLPPSAGPVFDEENLVMKIGQTIQGQLTETENVLNERISVLEEKLLQAVTLLHDVAAQTQGSFCTTVQAVDEDGEPLMEAEPLDPLVGSEDLILSYLNNAEEEEGDDEGEE